MNVPFKTRDLMQDDFEFIVRLCLTSVLFLVYIPPLYRTTYRIVQEKESRAKETMLIMGMSAKSYWLSWLVYYTIVNTVLTTAVWSVLAFVLFKKIEPSLLWVLLWLFGQTLFGLALLS